MSPRFGPYGQIQVLKAEVNRLIDLLLDEPGGESSGWYPAVDVLDEGGEITVRIELPGVKAKDLRVELGDGILQIRGYKGRLESEPGARRFHLMERFIGAFSVAVEIPQPVDPSGVRAVLGQGVLSVTFPRLDDRRHQAFTIEVEEQEDRGHE